MASAIPSAPARNERPRANERTVPCTDCGRSIPAARAALPITGGRCTGCNVPYLARSRAADAPMYETEAWAKGIRL